MEISLWTGRRQNKEKRMHYRRTNCIVLFDPGNNRSEQILPEPVSQSSPASAENSPPYEKTSTESGDGNMADGALTFVRSAEWQRLQTSSCSRHAAARCDAHNNAPCSSGFKAFHFMQAEWH